MYRGKQIFTPKVKVARAEGKIKGASAEPAPAHVHDHAHEEHMNAEVKGSKGKTGNFVGTNLPKARSGFGGGS
jgi:hypothetical protein